MVDYTYRGFTCYKHSGKWYWIMPGAYGPPEHTSHGDIHVGPYITEEEMHAAIDKFRRGKWIN